ncbi:MAG: SpoIID/LytB domain-containing protein [Bacteroides sp.]|nr:SpoIID/LytB domain-containing protein [Roseburia sp.]MCM1347283.1 SpoIID/LytB domain-containing protein [Bacteroides sp.]MCM1420055.1 SpoIID/LytB domain-containing protein [Bacteroides sp.]
MKEPKVSVGIVHAHKIQFRLNSTYYAEGNKTGGEQEAECKNGHVAWNGKLYEELVFNPETEASSFSISDVTIGINFHWERKEAQTFRGALKLVVTENKLCAINILPVEEYLKSVVSSEMNAAASVEFLKAHAVISRSWLIAQMEKRQASRKESKKKAESRQIESDSLIVRWYDQENHSLFDVCADDHCQRYQGITRISKKNAVEAVENTRGEVLTFQNEICDARFAKCCGGITELFGTCWEDGQKPYLIAKRDSQDNQASLPLPNEEEMAEWIRESPDAFCNTADTEILQQVLNSYDLETKDFYRWTVEYTQEEISQLICRKLGMDFGRILDMVPIQRGRSGRISLLAIIGEKHRINIGKELEIRRVLSENHLKSSAFIVEKEYAPTNDRVPSKFKIKGAGWGHGVGLCQIGAAVMGSRGYKYDEILMHYYHGSRIRKMY